MGECESLAWRYRANRRWATSAARRPTFLIILDACRVRMAGVPGLPPEVPFVQLPRWRKADFMLVFACDPGQPAFEPSSTGGSGHLTLAFIRSIQDGHGKTLSQVVEDVQRRVSQTCDRRSFQ